MRNTSALRAVCVLAILLSSSLLGCDFKRVSVYIRDFETADVEGVRLWGLSPAEGAFVPSAHVVFSAVREIDGLLWLDYTTYAANGTPGPTLQAPIVRPPGEPAAATLDIHFSGVEQAGWFRITTFNAAGESEFSEQQILL